MAELEEKSQDPSAVAAILFKKEMFDSNITKIKVLEMVTKVKTRVKIYKRRL
jgi:hypothetical protein